MLERRFHTRIKNASFPSPTDVGFYNLPSFGTERPRGHSFLSPIDKGSHPIYIISFNSKKGENTEIYP